MRAADGGSDGVPAETESLDALRSAIEGVDRRILAAVAERVDLARRIGAWKRGEGVGTLDPEREAAVIRRATELGREAGLDPEDARELFWTIVGICRRAQLETR